MKTDRFFKGIFPALAIGLAAGFLSGCAWLMERPEQVRSDVLYARSENEAEQLRQSLQTRFGREYPVAVGSGSISDFQPPRLREALVPLFPAAKRSSDKDAVVSVLGIIDSSGRVADAVVIESSDPDLNEHAISAFKEWRFEPQRYKGRRVWALVKQPVRFEKW